MREINALPSLIHCIAACPQILNTRKLVHTYYYQASLDLDTPPTYTQFEPKPTNIKGKERKKKKKECGNTFCVASVFRAEHLNVP